MVRLRDDAAATTMSFLQASESLGRGAALPEEEQDRIACSHVISLAGRER
jgi:hypothetical protein